MGISLVFRLSTTGGERENSYEILCQSYLISLYYYCLNGRVFECLVSFRYSDMSHHLKGALIVYLDI